MIDMPRSSAFSRHAARALALIALSCCGACIEVGHRAEIGCLVDPTEPGCTPDAGHDDAAADDPQDADGGTE